MRKAQRLAIERARERGTDVEREQSFILQASPFHLSLEWLYPRPYAAIEDQIEPVLFVLCVGGEARGEDKEGIEAVARVIMNRAFSNREYFGEGVRGVILKHNENDVYQFSAMNPQDPNRNWMLRPDAYSLTKVARFAIPIYFGQKGVSESRELYYFSKHITTPTWAETLEHTRTVGNHIFYRDKAV